MAWFEAEDGNIIITLRVIPRAAKNSIQGIMGDTLKVRIQAPPVEGKANAGLVKFISKQWNIPRSNIEILSGETGRNKRLRISHPTDALRKVLEALGERGSNL